MPTYWHFSISPSNEYSELISFRIDQFDLLYVQGLFLVMTRSLPFILDDLLVFKRCNDSKYKFCSWSVWVLLSRYVISGSLLSSLCSSILFTKIIIIMSPPMEAMRSSKLIYIDNLMFKVILFHMSNRTL